MSITSFSQNGSTSEKSKKENIEIVKSGPRMLIDSTGVKLIAFTQEDLDLIEKELKASGLKDKKIKELLNKVKILNLKLKGYEELTDSLESQYNKAVEISISKDGVIEANERSIKDLEDAVEKWEKIHENDEKQKDNLNKLIEDFNKRMIKRFWTIVGLVTTNVLTIILFTL
jgi:hypothetical protein